MVARSSRKGPAGPKLTLAIDLLRLDPDEGVSRAQRRVDAGQQARS
jgi:hypothetical protein